MPKVSKVVFLELRAAIAGYLRYHRRCSLVCFDRTLDALDIPDVLGVTDRRHLIEVEIKMSFSDFKADAKKRKWHRKQWLEELRVAGHEVRQQPSRMFYYAAPPAVAVKILPNLEGTEFGLLTTGGLSQPGGMPGIIVQRPMKPKKDRPRVPLRTIIKMADNQSGTLYSLAAAVARYEREKKPKRGKK